MTAIPVPYVAKTPVSVVSVGDAAEAHTVRAVLESYNFQVQVHWIGSRTELVNVLAGVLATNPILVLSCHGVAEGIWLPDEPALPPAEIATVAHLPGRTVINLGCSTGTAAYAAAFAEAGADLYVGPTEDVEGAAAIVFLACLFYLRSTGVGFADAVGRARRLDPEVGLFTAFRGAEQIG